MRVLFLDDSLAKQERYLGYGGFCVDDRLIRELDEALDEVKERHGVPRRVELKWSPPPRHFLRTKFKGVRQDLYRDVIDTLATHQARVLCAVHSLSDCYGVQLYDWSVERTTLWAAKQQLQFLAERFEANDLEVYHEEGLIISDRYGDRGGEDDLIRDFSFTMIVGTGYSDFERIALPPLMADSQHFNLIQAADVVTGVIVSTLGGSHYGAELFEDVARLFVTDPHHGAAAFGCMFSVGVLGYGLKLFPRRRQALRPEVGTRRRALDAPVRRIRAATLRLASGLTRDAAISQPASAEPTPAVSLLVRGRSSVAVCLTRIQQTSRRSRYPRVAAERGDLQLIHWTLARPRELGQPGGAGRSL